MRTVQMLLLLTACGPRGPGSVDDTTEASGPRIVLTSPVDGEDRYGSSLSGSFTVENFTLDEAAIGAAHAEGRGHVHAYIDGVMVAETAENSLTFLGVPSGGSTLEVRLADNDHAERGEGSWAWVNTLDPRLTILGPVDGSQFSTSSAALSLQLSDFALEAAFGGVAFGQGRYNVLLDDVVTDYGFNPDSAEVTQIAEGTHTLTVELATADGAPLEPPVRDSVTVEVLPGSPYLAVDRTAFLEPYGSATVSLDIVTANVPLDYHLYLDGAFVTRSASARVTMEHVVAGYHLAEIRLVDGGSELPIHDHVHLFIPPERPDITITYPGDRWGVSPAFTLTAAPENFTFDAAAMGGANVAGFGHLAVSVDGLPMAESGSGTVALAGLPIGDRVIEVELENNDHTPLSPPVRTTITVSVR